MHPNFFRTTTSVASLDAPRIEFVKAYGWHEVGIIYGDSVDYLKVSTLWCAHVSSLFHSVERIAWRLLLSN